MATAVQQNDVAQKHSFLDGFCVIHLHPTLRCNLRCKHCYSSSAPNLKGILDQQQVVDFLGYAREFGFNALSVSGGEPFLYRDLSTVLQAGKRLGFKNMVASNGMLLKGAKAQQALEWIDLIAISIDGDEALHDEIRCFDGAYKKMLEGVDVLRKHGKDFGFIHTVTPRSWEMLIDLADFVHQQGAQLFQLHPLELYGRAQQEMSKEVVGQELLHRVFIIGNYLRNKYQSKMSVQLDFLHRDYIEANPQTSSFHGKGFRPTEQELPKALKTIIVDEMGDIYPVSYGFSKQFLIGNIREIAAGTNIFKRFIEQKWDGLNTLFQDTFHEIIANQENDLVVWTEKIVQNSKGGGGSRL